MKSLQVERQPNVKMLALKHILEALSGLGIPSKKRFELRWKYENEISYFACDPVMFSVPGIQYFYNRKRVKLP